MKGFLFMDSKIFFCISAGVKHMLSGTVLRRPLQLPPMSRWRCLHVRFFFYGQKVGLWHESLKRSYVYLACSFVHSDLSFLHHRLSSFYSSHLPFLPSLGLFLFLLSLFIFFSVSQLVFTIKEKFLHVYSQ